MELSANAIQGYAYQESITGEKADDIQSRRLEEIGMQFYNDMIRAKKDVLMKKIEGLDVSELETAIAPLIAAKEAKEPVEEI